MNDLIIGKVSTALKGHWANPDLVSRAGVPSDSSRASSCRSRCDERAAWWPQSSHPRVAFPGQTQHHRGEEVGGRPWGVQGPPSVLPLMMPLVTKILILSPGSELGHRPALALTPQTLL